MPLLLLEGLSERTISVSAGGAVIMICPGCACAQRCACCVTGGGIVLAPFELLATAPVSFTREVCGTLALAKSSRRSLLLCPPAICSVFAFVDVALRFFGGGWVPESEGIGGIGGMLAFSSAHTISGFQLFNTIWRCVALSFSCRSLRRASSMRRVRAIWGSCEVQLGHTLLNEGTEPCKARAC